MLPVPRWERQISQPRIFAQLRNPLFQKPSIFTPIFAPNSPRKSPRPLPLFLALFYYRFQLHACSSKFRNSLNVSPRFFRHTPKTPVFACLSPLSFTPSKRRIPAPPATAEDFPLQTFRNAFENVLQPPKHSTCSKQTRSGFRRFSAPRNSRLFARFPALADRIQPTPQPRIPKKFFTFLKIILNKCLTFQESLPVWGA